ncbi:MAG: hypothetical protein GQ574_10040 [Crocinitomix sp.]|nr:hypothetical protein [Crocinitomix sp.]
MKIYNATEKDRVIFEANDFKEVSRRLIQNGDYASYEELSMRKLLTTQPGREIMKLQGEAVYLKTTTREKKHIISYTIYLNNTVISTLNLSKEGRKKARVDYMLNSNFDNFGLGEILLKELTQWVTNKSSLKELEISIFPEDETKRILFQNFGFWRTDNYLTNNSIPMQFIKRF